MTAKHTRAPWDAVKNKDGSINVVSAKDADGWIEKVALVNGRNEANARLIAAAPEMYEALEAVRAIAPKAIMALIGSSRDNLLLADEIHKADDNARAALALAQGRQP